MLSNLESQFFIDNGFIVFDELLTDVSAQIELINSTIDKIKIPTSKEESSEWVKLKSKIQSNKILLDLVNCEQISNKITNLLGDYFVIKSCQIACRFPGENKISSEKKWDPSKEWHIDNYTEKDFKRTKLPKDFSLLVGVYLTDNETDFSGNFTVFPCSHHQIQAFSNKNGGIEHYETKGLIEARQNLVLGKPHQIKAKKGSVVFAHRHLAHLISAPNNSDQIRTIIWFRVCGKNNSTHSFTNIWNDYTKLSKDTIYPKDQYENIIEIESRGYGYFVKNSKNEFVMRLKQCGKNYLPCMFASFITLTYNNSTHKVSVHTNGFINKNKHQLIANELSKKTLVEMAEWIYDCDYCDLIESWHPITKEIIDKTNDNKTAQKVIRLHHLHSKAKTKMLIKWGNELNLIGGILKGFPGLIVFEGKEDLVNLFCSRFKSFHWKHFSEDTQTKYDLSAYNNFKLIESIPNSFYL